MLKTPLILLGALFMTLPSASAREVSIDIQEQLKEHIDFILDWTTYEYKEEPLPEVKVIPHELLQIYVHGELNYAQSELKGEELSLSQATYDPERKTIYISEVVDVDSASFQATLVHELVHYLQDTNGYTDSLGAKYQECTESEAYEVQMVWQRIHNVDVEKISELHHHSLLTSIACMGSKSSAFKSRYDPNDPAFKEFMEKYQNR